MRPYLSINRVHVARVDSQTWTMTLIWGALSKAMVLSNFWFLCQLQWHRYSSELGHQSMICSHYASLCPNFGCMCPYFVSMRHHFASMCPIKFQCVLILLICVLILVPCVVILFPCLLSFGCMHRCLPFGQPAFWIPTSIHLLKWQPELKPYILNTKFFFTTRRTSLSLCSLNTWMTQSNLLVTFTNGFSSKSYPNRILKI